MKLWIHAVDAVAVYLLTAYLTGWWKLCLLVFVVYAGALIALRSRKQSAGKP